jgi:excinuclease UvrABC nuclease subunit
VLTERIEFHPEADNEFFANIAPAPAVFVLRGADPASEPYVSKTANLRRRLQRLLSPPEERTRRLNLRNRVRLIEYSFTGSDFESAFVLYSTLRSIFPDTYGNRLRLRFAPLVKLHLENEFPRASITTRLGKVFEDEKNPAANVYYGPFASRLAAEKFMNDALDFFKMRRCIDDLHPDPKFPGCVYSEMKMCLAPCYRGCTDAEYKSEVARVKEFFDTRGESLKRTIAGEREAASANMEFESAAAIHGRLNKLSALLQHLPDYVCRVDEMHAVIVQKAVQRMKQREVQKAAATQGKMFGDESPADAHTASVALFRVDAGAIAGPLHFSISSPEHTKSQSMEARIAEALSSFSSAKPRTTTERMEHLAILKRWCYRGSRAGEIFFADARGELPMRRLVRGISRVFKGEGRDDEMVPSPAD